MEFQEQSQLLSVPYEVLQAICANLIPSAIHVFLRQGKIAISTCAMPDTTEEVTGWERKPTGDSSDETIWARRLHSSWGPHWQCEEVAQKITGYQSHEAGCDFDQGETTTTLLFVCKRMHTIMLNLIASTAIIHVTDLVTLNHLAQNHLNLGLSPSPYGLLHAIGPLLRKLTITLRLPLSFFEAVSSNVAMSSFSGNAQIPDVSVATWHTAYGCERDLSSVWGQVWPALALRLNQLQSLHLWLDHDSKASWSFVDERAALSSFTTSMSPDKIPSLVDVSVGLPNLHPRYEKPERHFTKKSPQPPAYVTLNRRLRQRNFYEEDILGRISVTFEADFPVVALELLEYTEQVALDHQNLTSETLTNENWKPGSETREQFEDWERKIWESGEDPNYELMSLFGGHICFDYGR